MLIVFVLLEDAVQNLREEKPMIILSTKISLAHLSMESRDSPLFDSFVVITRCILSISTTSFHRQIQP